MRRWIATTGLLFLGLGVLLYGRALVFEFVELDDPLLILENPAAQSLTWPNIKTVFSTYDPELYIPLTFVSYQIDAAIGGIDPFTFHAHNILQHILNAWLFLLLAYALTKRQWVSLIAGLLFLVHPINVEGVLWISGRKDLLSMTFFLLALLLYVHRERAYVPAYLGSLVSFLFGLLSKVTVAPLPFVLILIDWYENRKITVRSLLEKLPYVALSIIFSIVALYGKSAAEDLPVMTRILLAAKSLMFSLEKILVPMNLSPMYADNTPISIVSLHFLIPLFFALALVTVAVAMRNHWRAFAASVAFILLMYAPSFANVVKNGDYYITADRYSYLPSLAVFLLAAVALARGESLLHRQGVAPGTAKRAVKAVAGLLIFVLALLSVRQSAVWSDTETLSRYVTETSPDARLGHMWYGNALRDAGKIDQALAQYKEGLSFGDEPQMYYNRSLAYEQQGNTVAAMADLEKAVSIDPGYALARINLGRLYYTQGRRNDAKIEFMRAAEAAPLLAMPLFNLGVLEAEEKHFETAADFYRRALAKDPTLSDARANLVIALLGLGQTAEAVEELKTTLKQDPGNSTANTTLEQLIKAGIVKTGIP
ncbi:tetratricopeptide repeat protein [Candidatus Peribacteria bacterium]|nr:tetratricopeptide repeat protein [Candidatus Peribacteria bacterium]